MIHFPVAFLVWLHVLFWGSGAAALAMPRPWRRFWPVLMFPAGLALQSAVVWVGAHTGLAGTNRYALASEVLPVILLVVALRRMAWRAARVDLERVGIVWMASAGVLLLLVAPLAWASKSLTTTSLGSCDAGDYAAGARVLQEFASTDRSGFLGLTEVVKVLSVDNFFDYWMRLNHFTPSALIAFNGSVLGCAPHELTGLLTMVLLAGSLPVVFWMARAVIGFGALPSVAVAVLYGLSPLTWYVVGHVATAQLIAALAVALITWAGAALWRGPLTLKLGAQFAGVLVLGYWLVLGSYNFFAVLCLVPAIAYAGGLAVWRKEWAKFGAWLAAMLAPLAVCSLLFAGRVTGLIERFQLLQSFDFGWKIPPLSPEGWLGLVSGPDLEPWHFLGLRWFLAAAVWGLLTWSTARAVREGRRKMWVAVAATVPVLVGYIYLEWRGARLGTNASYDAFKLFTVFYPVMLPAFCWWVSLRWSRRLTEWLGVMGVSGFVLFGNLVGTGMIFWRMATPPLIVDSGLRQVRKIEAMPDVASVNVRLPDMWSRLWANVFLLKKPQYFPTDTYEARWHTVMKGDWDLEAGTLAVRPAEGGRRDLTPTISLVEAKSADFVRVALGAGWHAQESDPRSGTRWQWTQGDAIVHIDNAHPWPLRVTCTLDGWSLGTRDLMLGVVGASAPTAADARNLAAQRVKTVFPEVVVPPGGTDLRLSSVQPWMGVSAGETRALGVCVFGLTFDVRR
jgi:hypothetical protein